MKKDFENEKASMRAEFNYKMSLVRNEKEDILRDFENYRKWIDMQDLLHEKVIDAYENEMDVFKIEAKKMRAILRVPRLCKMYHDQLAGPQMTEEFKVLEDIYE